MNEQDHRAALDRLYDTLDAVERKCGGKRSLKDCDGRMEWPARGVYFFFERGEVRSDGRLRVVRVGTHALTDASRTTLWDRLGQHRGQLSGRWAGGGNHRGSVFRLHVGEALLNRGGWPDEVSTSWKANRKVMVAGARDVEHALEQAVSKHIGEMPFLWVAIDDEPSPSSHRGMVEAGAIALLSNRRHPVDVPSPAWLGSYAGRMCIRESALWNVRHVDDEPTAAFLDVLEAHADAM